MSYYLNQLMIHLIGNTSLISRVDIYLSLDLDHIIMILICDKHKAINQT